MALEMKVFKEIKSYEAKVMWGCSFRQLAALAVMIFIGGGLFAFVTIALISSGLKREDATSYAMVAMFVVLLPAALWGWARPKGLKPEHFLGYVLRHYLSRKVIKYVDTYGPDGSPTKRREPVPPAGEPPVRGSRRGHGRAATPRRRSRAARALERS
ncbi:PrgI family protein [Clavibacter michiganensis]|uniref:PrgI family protein n=1 Tax=Clavibacter michiganensis TaxID=28447 RepID=UPI00292CAEAA|nr:PrgI family protein [Clavibacter michiganensis]